MKGGKRAGSGAPLGNKNGGKGRDWYNALQMAVKTYSTDKIKRGHALRHIADRVVEKALDGDKDAWQEIGNRFDGKPSQSIDGIGDGDTIVLIQRTIVDKSRKK
jgi:hypothetical protein